MRNLKKMWVYAVLLPLVGVAVTYMVLLTRHHWWIKSENVRVYLDGNNSTSATTYLSLDGRLMILIQKEDLHRLYILQNPDGIALPSVNLQVGDVSVSEVVNLGSFVFCSDAHPYAAYLDGSSVKVDFFNADLKVSSNGLKFNIPKKTISSGTIEVTVREVP